MYATLIELVQLGRPLLADGATGTNYFVMGLGPGDPPEFWNIDSPDKVRSLHQQFVDAGSDVILTNTFGCNRMRLKLHRAEHRVHELAKAAAQLARDVADTCDRPVAVAGSVGPTGELFEPMGALTEDVAIEVFIEEIEGLRDGGATVAWIETKSSIEEMRAAAKAAIAVGMPYTVTASFDTAGKTMMGVPPSDMPSLFDDLDVLPVAVGANCGVGASDLLVSVQAMSPSSIPLIAKSNCGIPEFKGAEVVYNGDPALMGRYARLAADSGVTIIGGCCGTTPDHLAAMRAALDGWEPGVRPGLDEIIAGVGPLTNPPRDAGADADRPARDVDAAADPPSTFGPDRAGP